MSQVLSDLGALQDLKAILNRVLPTGGNNYTLFLFVNDVTPSDSTVLGDLTEPTGGGYSTKSLTAGNWTVSSSGGIPQGAYAKQTFTFNGPLDGAAQIYGYGMKDADGVLRHAERASAQFTPVNNGDHYDVTPIVKHSKGTPT